MLDTGAQPSIIKKGCITPNAYINNKDIIQFTGITKDVVNTLGSLTANVENVPVTFHVVPDEFPIITQGFIGSSFFLEQNACINYGDKSIKWRNCTFPFKIKESVVLPPRTNLGVIVRVSNPEIGTGYLPRKQACNGVFAGDALVTCVNDKAYIRMINTLDEEIEIIIPTVTLLEVAQISREPPHEFTANKHYYPQNVYLADPLLLQANLKRNTSR